MRKVAPPPRRPRATLDGALLRVNAVGETPSRLLDAKEAEVVDWVWARTNGRRAWRPIRCPPSAMRVRGHSAARGVRARRRPSAWSGGFARSSTLSSAELLDVCRSVAGRPPERARAASRTERARGASSSRWSRAAPRSPGLTSVSHDLRILHARSSSPVPPSALLQPGGAHARAGAPARRRKRTIDEEAAATEPPRRAKTPS